MLLSFKLVLLIIGFLLLAILFWRGVRTVFRVITKSLTGKVVRRVINQDAPVPAESYPVAPFSSFTDGTLEGPGAFTTSNNLCVAESNYGENVSDVTLNVAGDSELSWGQLRGARPLVGVSGPWNIISSGSDFAPSNLPSGVFIHDGEDRGFENWDLTTPEGIQRFNLPKLANGDDLGGYFDYYYSQGPWFDWVDLLSERTSDEWGVFEIYQNGSVYGWHYKESTNLLIAGPILVVRWDGKIGPGGIEGTPEVYEDIPRPI